MKEQDKTLITDYSAAPIDYISVPDRLKRAIAIHESHLKALHEFERILQSNPDADLIVRFIYRGLL